MADTSSSPFSSSLFGYSKSEVEASIAKLTAEVAELEEKRGQMAAQLSSLEGNPPAYEEVGKSISKLLSDADAAATSMRDRAASESAALTRATEAETTQLAADAKTASEALRASAWEESQKILEDAEKASEGALTASNDAVRQRQAESEREAHRVLSTAKREAEEVIGKANLERDQTLQAAGVRKGEMLDIAKAAERASQQRARALEVRKEELLAELESVRETVGRLESDIEEKQTTLRKIEEPPASEAAPEPEWAAGIRIIPPTTGEVVEPVDEALTADDIVDDVVALQTEAALEARAARTAGRKVEAPKDEAQPESVSEPETELEPEPEPAAEPAKDKIGALFASLRGGGATPKPEPAPEPEASQDEAPTENLAPVIELAKKALKPKKTGPNAKELVDARDKSVLPVVNRGLKSLKRELASIQNHALEAIRLDDTWQPDVKELAANLKPALALIASESFGAGVDDNNRLSGGTVVVRDPSSFEIGLVARDLQASLARALAKGTDERAKASEVSRVFRAWRSEASERHLLGISIHAYNQGTAAAIAKAGGRAVSLLAGRGCATCKAAAGNSMASVPPLHEGCGCAVVRAE